MEIVLTTVLGCGAEGPVVLSPLSRNDDAFATDLGAAIAQRRLIYPNRYSNITES